MAGVFDSLNDSNDQHNFWAEYMAATENDMQFSDVVEALKGESTTDDQSANIEDIVNYWAEEARATAE